MQEVLKTARDVSGMSNHVRIRKEAAVDFSKRLHESGMEVPPWNRTYHFWNREREMVSYLLVLDSLNFCFWPTSEENRWEIAWGSRWLSGYFALAASLTRAMKSGIPLTRASYLAGLSLEKLREILGGRGELQLMEERVTILNELGHVLEEEYHGDASGLVEAAGGSAERLAGLLVERMSSFRDVAEYRGRRVSFYKRAQILCADLYGAFEGRRWGHFEDIDRLTAFADYKLPQVLRHLEILYYEHELGQRVDRMVPLMAGCPEEIEIRANTIWAVDMIREELASLGNPLRAFEIDWILWNLGQHKDFALRPHHRTVTIFY
jgi:hypothetical protein